MSGRPRAPYLPFFFGDFLASTATWDGEERSLFMLLLAYQWAAGSLPKDPQRIAKMAQYEWVTFKRLWSTIAHKFVESDSGLVNARLEEHRIKVNELGEKNRERAQKAAAGRWQGKNARSTYINGASSIHDKHVSSNAQTGPLNDAIQSNPIQSNLNQERKTTTAASRPEPPEFAEFKAAYPKRGGGNPWPRAIKAIRARLTEGHTWPEIIAGVTRYAAFVRETGREGTEFVMQAATFCGPDKRFLEAWEPPTAIGVPQRRSAKTVAELEAEEAQRASAGSP